MAEDILTMEERYAEAAVNAHDMDTIAAAGMAAQRNGPALTLFRLLDTLDPTKYKDCLADFTRLLLEQAKRQNMATITPAIARQGSELFLKYLMAPTCPTCLGRGSALIGNPKGGRGVLGHKCNQCNGTGHRNLRREAAALGAQMADLVMWLNGEVLSKGILAQAEMRRKRWDKTA